MAVSIRNLADALRVDDPDDPTILDALTSWLMAARELVGKVSTVDLPVAISDAAILRLASYWYDQPTSSRGQTYANALTNSGAGSLLAAWTVRRLVAAADELPVQEEDLTVTVYGIAAGWILTNPPTNPLESAFVTSGEGLRVAFPEPAPAGGYLAVWVEDRTPGNPAASGMAITHSSGLVPTGLYAGSPYPYSLTGRQGHLLIGAQFLNVGNTFDGQEIVIRLVE